MSGVPFLEMLRERRRVKVLIYNIDFTIIEIIYNFLFRNRWLVVAYAGLVFLDFPPLNLKLTICPDEKLIEPTS